MRARSIAAVACLISCARGGEARLDSTAQVCGTITCNTPPANVCADADNLEVFEATGTCDKDQCTYASMITPCPDGCANGQCNGDPCIGVSCNAPPAPHCSAANTKRVYNSPGTCSNGMCSYTFTDQNCPYGCTNGVCLDCMTDANCVAGKWCNGGTCVSCNSNMHCGTSCANCSASGDYCQNATSCVDCLVDSHCASGNWCSANSCATCNVNAHCGASCVACSGTTPTCNGSACVCSGSSCGSYNRCVSGACQECNTVSACGANCTACGGSTPYCLDEGATTRCVECLSNAQCTGGKTCANNFASISGCESSGDSADAAYRLYMKTGETMTVTLLRGSSTCTIGWNGTISLKIYGTACSADCSSCPNTCATNHYCLQANSQTTSFTAAASGWYDVVVDSRGGSTADTGGVFDLQVSLSCPGGCTCP